MSLVLDRNYMEYLNTFPDHTEMGTNTTKQSQFECDFCSANKEIPLIL
jgi:hypothetical protein